MLISEITKSSVAISLALLLICLATIGIIYAQSYPTTYPTGSYPTSTYPTGGSYPTSYPTTYPTGSYPTSTYPTGGSYPTGCTSTGCTGGSYPGYPTGTYPPGCNASGCTTVGYPTGYPTGNYPYGQSYPTGQNYPTGNYPTGQGYPTGGYPGNYPTGSYPTGGYPTGNYPYGQSYPTGSYPGNYPTGGYPTGNYPYQISYPTGNYPYGFPTGNYPVTGYPGNYPVTVYPGNYPYGFPTGNYPVTGYPGNYPVTVYPGNYPYGFPTGNYPVTGYPGNYPYSIGTPYPANYPFSGNFPYPVNSFSFVTCPPPSTFNTTINQCWAPARSQVKVNYTVSRFNRQRISFNDTRSTVLVYSNLTTTTAVVSVRNVTYSSPQLPPQYLKLVAYSINVTAPTVVSTNVTTAYPCGSVPGSSVVPMVSLNGAWRVVSGYSIDPKSCNVVYNVPNNAVASIAAIPQSVNVSTIGRRFNSTFNLSLTSRAKIIFKTASTNITLLSNSSLIRSANFTVANVTGTTPLPNKGYAKVLALNTSINSTTVTATNISVRYPCGTYVKSLAPYVLVNGAWQPAPSYTINANTCSIVFTRQNNNTARKTPVFSVIANNTAPIPVNATSRAFSNTTFAVSQAAPVKIAFANTRTNLTVYTNTNVSKFARVSVQNVSDKVYVPPNYTKLVALNISATPLTQALTANQLTKTSVATNVSMQYPCGVPSTTIAPYILANGTYQRIGSYTTNPTACTVSFTILTDPVVVLFEANGYAAVSLNITNSSVPVKQPTNQSNATARKPSLAISGPSSTNLIAIAVGVIAVVILIKLYYDGKKSYKGKKVRRR